MLENLHPFKSVLLYTKRRANMQQLFVSCIARRRWIASITPQGRVCESHTPFCCDVTESDQQSWLLSLQFMYRSKNSIDFQLPEHLNHANTIPLHFLPRPRSHNLTHAPFSQRAKERQSFLLSITNYLSYKKILCAKEIGFVIFFRWVKTRS